MGESQGGSIALERRVAGGRAPSYELAVRCSLAALTVAVCYAFQWRELRLLTSAANLRLDALAGISMQRLSADTVLWKGTVYRYENACTFIDVWWGAVPLLWNTRRTLARNLQWLLPFTLVLFAFNVARLTVSDVLFAASVPWNLAHNVVGGVAYFCVWSWLWPRRGFGPDRAGRAAEASGRDEERSSS